jgi:hypothetical protein
MAVTTLSPPGAAVDAYPVLQKAVNAGPVHLNAGVYACSKPVVLPMAAAITGDGSYRSIIQQSSPLNPGLAGTDTARVTLQGIGVTGPGKGPGSAHGIQLERSASPNTFGLNFDDVIVQAFGGHGISLSNPIVSHLDKVIAENCGQCGFYLAGAAGGAAGTSTVLTACYGNSCGQAGYWLATMTYSVLSGCAADGNGAGYVIEQCEGITLTSCGAEGTVVNGKTLASDGTSFRVDASSGIALDYCWCYANPAVTTHVSGGSTRVRVKVKDNSPAATATAALVVDAGSELE